MYYIDIYKHRYVSSTERVRALNSKFVEMCVYYINFSMEHHNYGGTYYVRTCACSGSVVVTAIVCWIRPAGFESWVGANML